MALRWKKNPRPTGLAGVCVGPQGSRLRDGDVEYARTYAFGRYHRKKGWYWTARADQQGVPLFNSCDKSLPDEAAAKAAAMAYVRECLKKKKEQAA